MFNDNRPIVSCFSVLITDVNMYLLTGNVLHVYEVDNNGTNSEFIQYSI